MTCCSDTPSEWIDQPTFVRQTDRLENVMQTPRQSGRLDLWPPKAMAISDIRDNPGASPTVGDRLYVDRQALEAAREAWQHGCDLCSRISNAFSAPDRVRDLARD